MQRVSTYVNKFQSKEQDTHVMQTKIKDEKQKKQVTNWSPASKAPFTLRRRNLKTEFSL